MVTIVTVWVTTPNFVSFHVIAFSWIPIVTSTINPVIITARREEARRFILENLARFFTKTQA